MKESPRGCRQKRAVAALEAAAAVHQPAPHRRDRKMARKKPATKKWREKGRSGVAMACVFLGTGEKICQLLGDEELG